MLKIGVLGAGHLGKIHIRLLKEVKEFQLTGFFDPDAIQAAAVSQELEVKAFDSIHELIREVDAVDIVTPTLSHFDCAKLALDHGKHIFIEKPLTNTIEEARELMDLVEASSIKAQVGHVERFNPAYLAIADYDIQPKFIETHRLSEFNPRGTDVSVVLDLMIHDIDIVLSLIKSKVKAIHASGVPVISETPDIANARVEFENGSVVNFTASRVSLKKMRKMRMFQKNAYITLDFLTKKAAIFKISELEEGQSPIGFVIDPGEGKARKQIAYSQPPSPEVNAIKMELEKFAAAIINDEVPVVTVRDGYNSLKLAHQILEKINHYSFT
ncbi:MAG: Gfo/Idh/MocA family oxidoreductase [Bacteroidia bacterium]